MKIIAIIGLILVAWMFADEIKRHRWRGIFLCSDVIIVSLIIAFNKRVGLYGWQLAIVVFGLLGLVPWVFSKTYNQK